MVNETDPNEVTSTEEIDRRTKVILEKYENRESDIPLSSDYWKLRNRYRELMRQ
jgi:dihydropteroate synthase